MSHDVCAKLILTTRATITTDKLLRLTSAYWQKLLSRISIAQLCRVKLSYERRRLSLCPSIRPSQAGTKWSYSVMRFLPSSSPVTCWHISYARSRGTPLARASNKICLNWSSWVVKRRKNLDSRAVRHYVHTRQYANSVETNKRKSMQLSPVSSPRTAVFWYQILYDSILLRASVWVKPLNERP